MSDFRSRWATAARYRRVSRALPPLVHAVYRDLLQSPYDSKMLTSDLERLLSFLASGAGRTDANCRAVDRFFSGCERLWKDLPPAMRQILDAMSGTLRETVCAPHIAANFGSLPEQLLEQVRRVILSRADGEGSQDAEASAV